MSKYSILVGDKIFDSKSKALDFYKNILNSYGIGEVLNRKDYMDVMDLIYMDWIRGEIKESEEEGGAEYDREGETFSTVVQRIRDQIQDYECEVGEYINAIKVDFHPEFKTTKCFYCIGGKDEQLFSYILAINGAVSDSQRFSKACRHLVAERLREFKKQRFESRPVRCAISNEIIEWEDCHVDHKSPLTFSVIVKSFIISNKIDVGKVRYTCEITVEKFADQELADKFNNFHKEMAVLRVLSKKQNAKLSGGARIKPTKKDGTLL